MTNIKKKITLFICLVLSLVMIFVLSSCDNTKTSSNDNIVVDETNVNGTNTNSGAGSEAGDSNSNTEIDTDSTNTGTTDTDTSTDTSTDTGADTPGTPDDECTHVEEIIPAVAPSCTETGLTEGKKCSACGEILVNQETVSATGHKFENSYICTVCNNEIYKESNGLEYTISGDGTYYIVSKIGTCTDTDIVIPYTYESLPVKEIGSSAFYNCTSLTSVVIPNSVTKIGIFAFAYCDSLTSVVIGNSVTTIRSYAFEGCTSLDMVNYLGTIEEWCNISFGFSSNPLFYASKLHLNGELVTELVIPNTVTEIKAYAFQGCTSLTSIEIPNSVTTIGDYAFNYCTSLTSIVIPNSVTTIGGRAFDNCTSLTSVVIGNSVTSIGSSAFEDCDSLTSVEIPNSVTFIGIYAFSSCTALTEIKFNAIAMNDLSSRNYVFYNAGKNGNGIKVTIGKNVTKIPAYLFCPDGGSNSPKITSVVFEEDSVCESIGNDAFYYCTSLKSIVIPNSVTYIKDNAFYYCTSLKSIVIPNSVTHIGWHAFYDCGSLVEVYNLSSLDIIAGSSVNGYVGFYAKKVHTSLEEESILKTVDDYVFAYVSNDEIYLVDYIGNETELTLPESYNGNNYEIYDYAFYNRDDITKVIIPNSITSIGHYAFENCTSLTSVVIGNSVTSIGRYAFAYCDSLTSIVIGNSVTFGSNAFEYCYKLVEVYNLSSLYIAAGSWNNGDVGYYAKKVHTSLEEASILETVGDYIFMTWEGKYYLMGYIGNETEITLPESYNGNNYEIYDYAFYNRDDITKVIIPNSVTSIGNNAFDDCTSLDMVNYLGTIEEWCNISFDGSSSNPLYYAKKLHLNGKLVTELVIPNTVTEIKAYAFYGCDSLTSIEIPNSLTYIGYSAFSKCDSLTSIVIPNSVTSIGSGAFSDCDSLTSVNYLGTIEEWCNISFRDDYSNPLCYGANLYLNGELVTELVIPNTITEIKAYAFRGCTSLTSIVIPNSVTSIGEWAFYNCTSLTIYCEATSEPTGWDSDWNSSNRPVYWYSESEPASEGNYWHYVNGEVVVW